MKRNSIHVVICATLLALIFAMGWLPYVFLLPVLLACTCFNFRISMVASFFFGVVSLIYVFMFSGLTLVGIYFLNYPWLPIAARIPIGFFAHGTYVLIKKLIKRNELAGEIAATSIAGIVGSISNTILVGALLLLLPTPDLPDGLKDITLITLVISGGIEAAIASVVLPPLTYAVKRAIPRVIKEVNYKPFKAGSNTQSAAENTEN